MIGIVTGRQRRGIGRTAAATGGVLAGLLAGCQTDGGDRRRPPPPREAAPAVDGGAASRPREGSTPTIRLGRDRGGDGPREVVVARRSFSERIRKTVRLGDLIEVDLANGGRARGEVRVFKAGELVLTSSGTRVVTRLAPRDVVTVRVVYRAPPEVEWVTGDDPRTRRETWLERYDWLNVIQGEPAALWAGRYDDNVPLEVARAFNLQTWTFVQRAGNKPLLLRERTLVTVEPGSSIKLAGVVEGLAQRGNKLVSVGDVHLLLHRGADGEVSVVYTSDPLQASDLDRGSLRRYAEREPLTFAAYRPGDPPEYVKIVRAPVEVVRAYMNRIARLPGRPAVRRMRAADDPALDEVEERITGLYARVGLKEPVEQQDPLIFEFRIPALIGGLRLVPFRRELGLD